MLTEEQQEAARQERLNEPGTEAPCPFCQRPRVKRSNYIRCHAEGINWLDGENLDRNPKAERWEKFLANVRLTRNTRSSSVEPDSTVPTAR